MTIDTRLEAASKWLNGLLPEVPRELIPVSGDASFRRYFRIPGEKRSLILMDAPPEQEDSRPFTDIAARLRTAGLNAPEIYHFDHEQGFGLIEDLGDQLYRELITQRTANGHIASILSTLKHMNEAVDCDGLPDYDDHLLAQELALFPQWYLTIHKNRALTLDEQNDWTALSRVLLDSAAEQPRGFVHRDFHSCNLLHVPGEQPGIIDFQDGVRGPLTYDFVSLIWDRYIAWPRPQLEQWMQDYFELVDVDIDPDTWMRWCDWMGLQRNFKIVGIFARLHYRDQREGYLEMIPQFHRYLVDVMTRYDSLAPYQWLLEDPTCAP